MANKADLIGQTFGTFSVFKKVDTPDRRGRVLWLCTCSACGYVKAIPTRSLQRKEKCGCQTRANDTGKKYGRLIVVEDLVGSPHKCRCLCECGEECIVSAGKLRMGHTQSCGCLQVDRCRGEKGGSGFNRVWKNTVNSAKIRGHLFALSKEQLRDLHRQPCTYCGQTEVSCSVAGKSEKSREWSRYSYNGVDRVDSLRGYTFDNVVTCCIVCNAAKAAMSLSDFRAWVIRVHEYWAKVSPGPADKAIGGENA
jgi:hypothetical protein